MNYLLGTDIGTSGTKTILMDTTGKLIAQDDSKAVVGRAVAGCVV